MRNLGWSVFAIVFSIASAIGADPESPPILKFQQVNDHLYRGAQPVGDAFKALAKIGVKTVIDLRDGPHQYAAEKKTVESLGMKFESVPMSMHAPTDDQIAKVLAMIDDKSAWPVFLHCQGGRDRTSTVIACYRVAHDGWSNQKAYEEAEKEGISKLDVGLRHYILHYQPGKPSTPLPVK
jgi:protein tyrosine phosphatase (PTP) superfamily phosphohydrolase (DUF442 family)